MKNFFKAFFGYFKLHKFQSVVIAITFICAIIYATTGQNIDPKPLIEKACNITGWCTNVQVEQIEQK